MLQNVDQLRLLEPLAAAVGRFVLLLHIGVDEGSVVRWPGGDSRERGDTAAHLALHYLSPRRGS